MTTRDLCSPCYWGECLEKIDSCTYLGCICRCRPRRPVSDSTNVYVRRALAKALRAYIYGDSRSDDMSSVAKDGVMRAARLIEEGEI